MLTRDETVAHLAALGHPMRPATWSSMVSRGQAPKADEMIGRTPRWAEATIDTWAANRPGQGARTDIRRIPMRNETVTADCPPATLADIVMQTWPARGVPSVGDGRWATVTIPASNTQELGRELDARGIEWGLA